MPSSDKFAYDDELLVRYLLGVAPADQAERLDELSVSDDEFAWRLTGLENDLVDIFVRGELRGEHLKQFNSFYLSSPKRRQKVEFAEGLRQFQQRAAMADAPASVPANVRPASPRMFIIPRSSLQWGFAVAAVLLVVFGYLIFDNARLRREVGDARAHDGSHTQQLEKELADQRARNAEIQKELERTHQSKPELDQLKTVSLLLPPPTRGLSAIKTALVPRGTDLVVLVLTLESADFPEYRVTLKDPATNKVVWRSAEIEPTPMGDRTVVSISLRADRLRPQDYFAEVTGLSPANRTEIVGDYAFRVVLR